MILSHVDQGLFTTDESIQTLMMSKLREVDNQMVVNHMDINNLATEVNKIFEGREDKWTGEETSW